MKFQVNAGRFGPVRMHVNEGGGGGTTRDNTTRHNMTVNSTPRKRHAHTGRNDTVRRDNVTTRHHTTANDTLGQRASRHACTQAGVLVRAKHTHTNKNNK